MENWTLEQQTNDQHNKLERFVDRASQNQVKENNADNKNRRTVENAVFTVENRMHDEILAAMDKVVTPRVELHEKSRFVKIWMNSQMQKPDRTDFSSNAGKIPLMLSSSRIYLDQIQNKNDETRKDRKTSRMATFQH